MAFIKIKSNMENVNKSNWIWTGERDAALNSEPQFVFFRKKLHFDAVPRSFTVNLSADSRYKLYVNGRLVSAGPEKGDRQVWFYDTIDLTPYMIGGENILAAEVLRYPLIHNRGNHSVWRTETPGFYFKGILERSDGESEEISADETWRMKIAENISIISENLWFAPLQIFESSRGDRGTAGWKKVGYSDNGWSNAVPYGFYDVSREVSPGNLMPRTIPLMYQTERKLKGALVLRESSICGEIQSDGITRWNGLLREEKPLTVPANSTETVELDAGELTCGYLNLRLFGGGGANIKLLYSESYAMSVEGKDFPVKKDRMDYINGTLYGYSDEYTVDGYGDPSENVEEYEPFWFRSFRFIRLEIKTGDFPLTLERLNYRETGYPLEVKSHVKTSDKSLDSVWEISERTLRRCMHETYEDCPFYEQLQYVMDSRAQMLYTYQLSADDRLARKCMDDFRRSARYDGLLNGCYPSYGPNVIPGFSIYYILMLHDHMMYFGDRELIRTHMPTADGILEFFRRNIDSRGLVGNIGGYNGEARYWSFIDWVDGWKTGVPTAVESGPITMESMLYVFGLQRAAELAKYIGRHDTALEYTERAKAVQSALRNYCRGERGLYTDGPGVVSYSEHCQVFAVLTDTAEPDETEFLMREITDRYYGDGREYSRCSVAMKFYMFRALEKTGLYERCDRLWDTWREMTENNLTTCMESDSDPRSECHAWGSTVLYELTAAVLGVRPSAPGYSAVSGKVQTGHYDFAEGEVITPHGLVRVSWKKDGDGSVQISSSVEDRSDASDEQS